MKIFQVVDGVCKWLTPFTSMKEVYDLYPPDLLFVQTPDWVGEGYTYDDSKLGDERFIMPEAPEGFIYDDETGELVEESKFPDLLLTTQLRIQKENTDALAKYLESRSVTYTDGKQYGVTLADQNEINTNLSQYEVLCGLGVENPPLEWHSIKEACVPWKKEDLLKLVSLISAEVYPAFKLMNLYKDKIFKLEDRKAIRDIKLIYSEDIIEWLKEEGNTIDNYVPPVDENEDKETEEDIEEDIKS